MLYLENNSELHKSFESIQDSVVFENKEIHRYDFHSIAHKILPGVKNYYCNKHQQLFEDNIQYLNDIGKIDPLIDVKDIFVEENNNFHYHVLFPINNKPVKKVTLLLHGFNEKYWDKYLPWGNAICNGTQSAVVFFPIAFHMQRAPHAWSEKRKMFELSQKRREKYPNIIHSTLSNVAISMRLHSMPQRFIWSGLQTYYDVIQLIDDIRKGSFPIIDRDCSINVFAFSIGGLLTEILKLTNYNNYFSDSKICLFCSGSVFNRLSPVSKFILDSEANVALYSFLVEHFDSMLRNDAYLKHYIDGDHDEGKVFHSMLDYQKMRGFREGLLKKYEKQIYAISLKKDTVFPSFEVVNTLNGAYRDINIRVDDFDFEYDYKHENPFPGFHKNNKLVEQSFNTVFNNVCDFLN